MFGLGDGQMSSGPVAYGRIGEVWRLDCEAGSWAVKTEANALSEKGLTTPVFFLSGALQEESAAELSDLGASAFFAKPISIFPLLEAIRRELRIDESTL